MMKKIVYDRKYRYFMIFCFTATIIINGCEFVLDPIYKPTLNIIDNLITISFFIVSAVEFLLLYADTKKQSLLATSLLFVGFTVLMIKLLFF